MNASGIVLCGGQSSRMGRPKALLPWRGRMLIEHVVGILRAVVEEVVVVGTPALELPPLDARVVVDREPGLGPLAGLREGLEAIRADRAFVTGADAPYLEPLFVEALLGFGDAAAPLVDGYVQTLCAVYPRRAAAEAAALLAAGRRRPLDLLEAVGFRRVAPEELPDVAATRGLNTPEAYLSAVRADLADATATLELLGQARRRTGQAELEVSVGTLAEILAQAGPDLGALAGGELSRHYLVSLEGRRFLRDLAVPIGPGEHVVVMDAASGG
jgi:molybdopterin-guanine dinucleotide biosynthesis protein A